MPKTKKPESSDYPYKIPPFSGDPSKIGKRPPVWVNEYFLIEALLRSQKVMKAYRRCKERALMAILKEHGIIEQDPLRSTHHALLLAPSEDSETNEKWAELGYVDMKLQIRDLGAVAKRPANTIANIGGVSWSWGFSGEEECLGLLRNPHPRYLFLQIDVSHPPTPIIHRLLPLLKERHEAFKTMPPPKLLASSYRLLKTPFDDIPAWLRYFQCYDLRVRGKLTYGQIALQTHGNHKMRDNPEKAVRCVNRVIRAAEDKAWPPVKPSR